MGISAMEIRHNEGRGSHSLGLDRATRDALATYVRLRWAQHTAKHVAAEWDLTLDEAKGLVAGRTSLATLDRIFKHKRGGWAVILPVMGAVVGQTIEQFTASQIEEIRHERAELEALDQGLRDRYARLRSVRLGPDRSFGPADPPHRPSTREDRGRH